MKQIYTILSAVLITATVWAQAPEKMSYQAVIRDASDNLITNTQVGMQISILQGSATGTAVYTETQTPTTNANGLVTIEIGTGTLVSGDFATIDWANDSYYIKTETDPAGGTNYTITGVSQLLSVPYALHAKTAQSITGTITETDPIFGTSVAKGITQTDTTNWNSKLDSYTETDPVYTQSVASEITATDTTNWNRDTSITNEIQQLSIENNQLSIENGNTVSLPAGGGSVPVYTTNEIAALTPAEGDAVFNSTEKLYQIYEGGVWQSFNANCWPQPTTANAGTDQTFNDGTVTATLAANSPISGHGIGAWSILSGTGGSFTDDTDPATTFNGTECTAYTLQWTISTSCNSSSDNVNIEFNQTPTVADAGTDQTFNDGTVTATLAANSPISGHGTGAWSIVSGTGGSFTDDTDPATTFSGVLHGVYTLRWTITNNCSSSTDDVVIAFNQDGAGSTLTDVDGNTYNTVYIGNQLWMAENLKVTKEADGTAIPLVTNDNDWENLGDNDTDKAYCYYNNSTDSLAIYGALYTYSAAKDACPTGWHLPNDDEWNELTDFLGGESVAGGKMKETGTVHWSSPNTGATNSSGFNGLPGGKREGLYIGSFSSINSNAHWWGATEDTGIYAYDRFIINSNVIVGDDYFGNKSEGLSVRCVKD